MRRQVNEGGNAEGARPETAVEGRPTTRRGRRAVGRAVVAGVLLALVAGMLGFPPTSASGVTLDGTTSTTSDGDLTGGQLDDAASDDGEEDSGEEDADPVGELTNTLEGEVERVTNELPLTDDPLGDEEGENDDGGTEEDPDAGNEPEEGDPPPEDSGEVEDDSSEDVPSREKVDNEGDEEAPARTAQVLSGLRALDATSFAPIVDVESGPVWRHPRIDFVDVPLGPRSTKDVIQGLQAVGASSEDIAELLAPFPVIGEARYSNDWGAPRHTPSFHSHEGTDVFASRGTPVVSSLDGIVTNIAIGTAVGGNSVHVTSAGGTYAYYAHLEEIASGLSEGDRVGVGDPLGTVGTSGNAVGTPPHLHFEIHPDGGDAKPPLPYLDRWLANARARAEQFIEGDSPGGSAPVAATALPGRVQLPAVNPFENAATRRDSPAAALALVAVLGGLALAIRQRRRFAKMFAIVGGGVAPVTDRLGIRRLHTKNGRWAGPADGPSGHEVRDVLAPLLDRDDGSDDAGDTAS